MAKTTKKVATALETLPPIYVTTKGVLTHRRTKTFLDVAEVWNEQYRRDQPFMCEPTAWGVLNRKTGKLSRIVGSRDTARALSERGKTMPVALFFDTEAEA